MHNYIVTIHLVSGQLHSPGHSSIGVHLPLCTTVSVGQLQPGSQMAWQTGFWFQHVPSQPLHSLKVWPSIGHTVWSRSVQKEVVKATRKLSTFYTKRMFPCVGYALDEQ